MGARRLWMAAAILSLAQATSLVNAQAQVSVTPQGGRRTISEVDPKGRGRVYLFALGGGSTYMMPQSIEILASGEWREIHFSSDGSPFSIDLSPFFGGSQFVFEGDIKEFVCAAALKKDPNGKYGYGPDDRTRIISAALRDYEPGSGAASPPLSTAGAVEIDANGFARGANVKSGWLNMAANLAIGDDGRKRFVRLYDIKFWIAGGGKEWLSFGFDHATISDDQKEGGHARPLNMSVARSPGSATGEGKGNPLLLVGQHRLRVVLPTLQSPLRFVEENAPTANDVVRSGDAEKIKEMLRVQPSLVSSKDVDGRTPLHWAAFGDRKEIAELLLANQADANARDNDGLTTLHFAAASVTADHMNVVRLLLANGADVNAKSNSGITPLGSAVLGSPRLRQTEKDHKDAVELLLSKGADVNARDQDGGTPLHFAAIYGQTAVAHTLLAHAAAVNAGQNDGRTPLHFAAANGFAAVVALLLEKGANVNARSTFDNTPLHSAAAKGQKDVAAMLRLAGSDVNAKNKDGDTPLHFAVARNFPDLAELLLAVHADVNAKNGKGDTPLAVVPKEYHYSIRPPDPFARGEMADLLRKHGGRDIDGEILNASKQGDLDKVKALLGENPKLIDCNIVGWTPLHYAAYFGHKDLAELLLVNGADANVHTDGLTAQTPWRMAEDQGHKDVQKLFRQRVRQKAPHPPPPVH